MIDVSKHGFEVQARAPQLEPVSHGDAILKSVAWTLKSKFTFVSWVQSKHDLLKFTCNIDGLYVTVMVSDTEERYGVMKIKQCDKEPNLYVLAILESSVPSASLPSSDLDSNDGIQAGIKFVSTNDPLVAASRAAKAVEEAFLKVSKNYKDNVLASSERARKLHEAHVNALRFLN